MAAPRLSFPRPVFAKLSPHPYLLRNLSPPSASDPPCRTNGRAPHEARPVHIHTSSLSHAHGSALVRTGDTTVICGVRGEVLPVTAIPQYRPKEPYSSTNGNGNDNHDDDGRAELKNYDLLVPNIELATACAPQFLPHVPPTVLAQTLSTRVYSLLHSSGAVDARDLRIWYIPEQAVDEVDKDGDAMARDDEDEEEEEDDDNKPQLVAYWVLYIDLLFVSFDGNPFDAAWAAVVAALRDTKLPRARWDPDREMVLCSRAKEEQNPLCIRGLPVACTAVVFLEKEHGEAGEGRHWLLLDPDRLEESLCRESIAMVVDCSGGGEMTVRAVEKHGGTVISRELIRGFAGVAQERWKEVTKAMK